MIAVSGQNPAELLVYDSKDQAAQAGAEEGKEKKCEYAACKPRASISGIHSFPRWKAAGSGISRSA